MTSWNEFRRELEAERPATRVGRYLLFAGGVVTRLTRWEHLLFALGVRKSIPRTNDNRRYP